MDIWSTQRVLDAVNSGKKIRIIDVREPYEFSEGHIPGAELIPLGQISGAITKLSKDDSIVVVCRSGARSLRASQFLSSQGFKNVINMQGGMLSWRGTVAH